ncbi:MAG: WbqC family protein [Candidatus Omnitrophica bacterium]|nr:WbqC family protein [Candidatus Omnitrophota bacterium]
MVITIHQPQYMPWLGYFDKISKADVFVLLDNVQFKKNEWQNRNRIRTPQGWQWLTIPVLHDFGQKINEIKINNKEPWRKKHLRAIELNYVKARFFEQYFPHFQDILNKEWDNLAEVNICLIRKIMELLGIKTRLVLSCEYEAVEHKTLRLVDLCKHFNANTYLSGEGGLDYLDEGQFKLNNIDIIVQKYEHPVYNQMWMHKNQAAFVSHLSVLDLLFNCGPESFAILTAGERAL